MPLFGATEKDYSEAFFGPLESDGRRLSTARTLASYRRYHDRRAHSDPSADEVGEALTKARFSIM